MSPVVEIDGRSTARQIIFYSVALIPVTLVPTFLGMAGTFYAACALLLGLAMLYFGWRLAHLKAPIAAAISKRRARQFLQAPVSDSPISLLAVNPHSCF